MTFGWVKPCLVLIICAVATAQSPDLREQYGAKDAKTAQEIEQAINEAQAHHPAAAISHIDAALKQEPQCAGALMWKGLILRDSGDLDQASQFLQQSADSPTAVKDVTARSALELGLLFGEIDKLDDSNQWLSRAIVADERDEFHLRWRAWKIMAQNLGHQGHKIAAGWAAILAYQSDPQQVDAKLAQQYLTGATPEETLRVLFLKDAKPPDPGPRTSQSLSPIGLSGDDIPESVTGLWPDPAGRYVLAMVAPQSRYYVISGDALRVKRVELSGPIACTCLTAGRLFILTSTPSELREVEPQTGKAINAWRLDEQTTPSSLAVFSSRNCAFYTVGEKLRRLDLTSGSIVDMPYQALLIRGDPAEQWLFGMTRGAGPGMVTTRYRRAIIGGRMITVPELIREPTTTTYLFKYLVDPQGMTPVEARANVAVNGAGLYVSPDGLGVAVPGTGGWRPREGASRGGYVVPVFSSSSLSNLRGIYATDPSPIGIAINPVTQQVATLRYAELRVRNPTENTFFSTLGGFNGRCVWTGNGRFLLIAYSSGGLRAFENYLTDKERNFASSWWKSILPDARPVTPAAQPIAIVKISTALSKFSPIDDPTVVRPAISKSLEPHDVPRPPLWTTLIGYSQNVDAMKVARELSAQNSDDDQSSGVRIYKLRKAVKDHPGYAPLKFLLAEALSNGGQGDAARQEYLDVIHSDAGRTELTSRSLNGLAAALHESKQDVQAAYCLASSLTFDRDNPNTRSSLAEELELLHYDAELKLLNTSGPTMATRIRVPKLPIPKSLPALHGEVLFERAVGSIVLIRCGEFSGTGICVGDSGTILTNQHVIRSGAAVFVTPFAMKNGKLEKLAAHPAQVLYASQQQDMAILHIDQPPPTLVPLPVAAEDARVGQRVFCIGNPGLGDKVLEQTMSEGIISATERNIRGQEFLQHTAAVNPGNSGGPLLDEGGQVVGVITLQAALENVSFAIPASRVRRIFAQQTSGR